MKASACVSKTNAYMVKLQSCGSTQGEGPKVKVDKSRKGPLDRESMIASLVSECGLHVIKINLF